MSIRDFYDDTLGIEWQWQSADGCIVKAPLGKRSAEGQRHPRRRWVIEVAHS